MLIVGLTGGVGSGKSTVARLFADRGARIIDADLIAREVVEPGTQGFEEVVACFGEEIVGSDGRLDRGHLARIVFSDPDARQTLEKIIHPKVRSETSIRLSEMPDDAFALLVVPLLIESGEYPTDKVVVVDCDEELATERMIRDRGWTVGHARQRIEAQLPRAKRNAAADYIIDNDGDLEELRDRVEHCIEWLLASVQNSPADDEPQLSDSPFQ